MKHSMLSCKLSLYSLMLGLFDPQVAGAAADAGLSLADVAAEAKHASEVVGTMGVALSVCTLPGQVTSDRLGPKQMELGLGIVSLNRACYYTLILCINN